MSYHIKNTRIPRCKTCGNPVYEFNPWAGEHEHTSCAADRISDILIKILMKELEIIPS